VDVRPEQRKYIVPLLREPEFGRRWNLIDVVRGNRCVLSAAKPAKEAASRRFYTSERGHSSGF
jgi:hypothetical protein